MGDRTCRSCGCTDDDGCYDGDLEISCHWSQDDPDLCSFCEPALSDAYNDPRDGFPNLERAGFVLP